MVVELIFYGIGLILTLVFFIGAIKHLIKIRKDKKKRLLFIGWLILLVGIIYTPLKIVDNYAPKYFPTTSFLSKTNLEDTDSLLTEAHKHYKQIAGFKWSVQSIRSHINYPLSSFKSEPRSVELMAKFNTLIKSSDSTQQDYGHVFMAIHLSNLGEEVKTTQHHLDLVSNRTIAYFNYAQGLAYYRTYYMPNVDSSEYYLLKSIEENFNTSDSYAALSRLYYKSHQDEKLAPLLQNEYTSTMVPYWVKRSTYFAQIDFVNYWNTILSADFATINMAGSIAAFLILCLWLYFLRKMDIYEPEKWHHLITTFLLSIICLHLIYPAHDFLWGILDYYRPSIPISDFAYITVSVGMVEEFVKILPVLIMLKFSKAINEPFDYILYASVSALGFAFVENIGYFGSQDLGNIAIRGFQCCLVHIALSSTIGYGLMLGKYRKSYHKFGLFLLFFLIASALHGFYDFWLMNWWAVEYDWLSEITTIILLHLWIMYANNTLNISNFYRPEVIFYSNRIKHLAFTIFIAILMLSYTIVSFNYGWQYGDSHLASNAIGLILIISYFTLSLGFMSITRGYLKPLQIPFNFLFGSKKGNRDLSDLWIKLTPSSKFNINEQLIADKQSLATTCQLLRRVVIDNNLNGYLVQLAHPINFNEGLSNHIILVPEWEDKKLSSKGQVLVQIYLINSMADLEQPLLDYSDFKLLGRVFSTYLPTLSDQEAKNTEVDINQTALNA